MLKIKNKYATGNNETQSNKGKKNAGTKYVQELLGIKNIKDNTISIAEDLDAKTVTNKYYIRVNPKNISILQDASLHAIIDDLKKIINMSDSLELLVVDKTERVDDNKNFLKELIDRKENPLYKELLQRDLESLNKEFSKGASREFYFVVPYKKQQEKEILMQFERAVEINNFEVLKTVENDIKNMLQVYLERNFTGIVVKDNDL